MSNTKSYFDPKLTGGSGNSLGLEYQDYCCLIFFFKYIENPYFQSLTVETLNDFTILMGDDTELLIQVKKRTFTIGFIKQLLTDIRLQLSKKYIFICTSCNNKLKSILLKKEHLISSLESHRSESEKAQYIQDFKQVLSKNNLQSLYQKLMETDIVVIPEECLEAVLFLRCSEWAKKRNLNVSINNLLNELKAKVSGLRSSRGEFTKENFNDIVRKHLVDSDIEKIVRKIYDLEFKRPPEILRILGETKEEILSPLADKVQQADDFIANGDYKEALRIYRSVAGLFPKEQIFIQCAMLCEMIEDYSLGISYCDDALQVNLHSFEAFWIKGDCLGKQEEFDEAIINFEKALDITPSAIIYYNIGYTYYRKTDHNSAIENYKKCIELDKNLASAHNNLGRCYYENGSYPEALEHFNKALELEPEMPEALGNKGELLRFFGIYDDAIKYFEQCLNLAPSNCEALYGISLCLIETGKAEGLIYLAEWIKRYLKEALEGKVGIIDIGWQRTLPILLEPINKNRIKLTIFELELIIELPEPGDYVFIGAIQLSDDTGSMLYPCVGKCYRKNEDYIRVLKEIQEKVPLFQYFDTPIHVNFEDDITVSLQERDGNVYIEIKFNDYAISGITDAGNKEGFYAFIDYYEEYSQFRVILINSEKQEQFVIDAIESLEIERL